MAHGADANTPAGGGETPLECISQDAIGQAYGPAVGTATALIELGARADRCSWFDTHGDTLADMLAAAPALLNPTTTLVRLCTLRMWRLAWPPRAC